MIQTANRATQTLVIWTVRRFGNGCTAGKMLVGLRTHSWLYSGTSKFQKKTRSHINARIVVLRIQPMKNWFGRGAPVAVKNSRRRLMAERRTRTKIRVEKIDTGEGPGEGAQAPDSELVTWRAELAGGDRPGVRCRAVSDRPRAPSGILSQLGCHGRPSVA